MTDTDAQRVRKRWLALERDSVVVDDTIGFDGVKIRLLNIYALETGDYKCAAETALGGSAAAPGGDCRRARSLLFGGAGTRTATAA